LPRTAPATRITDPLLGEAPTADDTSTEFKRPGRRRIYTDPMKKICLRLDESTVENAGKIGDGNLSAGIRKCVEIASKVVEAEERGGVKGLAPVVARAQQNPDEFFKSLGRM
jgi:hypothetical protein